MKTKTLSRFKKMIKPYWKVIIVVTILSIIIDLAELVKPYIIQQIIDNFLREKNNIFNNITIDQMVIFYVLLVIFGNVIDYINRCVSYNLGESVVYNLRLKLFKFIEKANLKETSRHQLALKCDIEDTTKFVNKFIDYDRRVR